MCRLLDVNKQEKLLGSLTSRAYVMRYLADGMVGLCIFPWLHE